MAAYPEGDQSIGSTSEMDTSAMPSNILIQFTTPEGEVTGQTLDMPSSTTVEQLAILINHVLSNDEPRPYAFYVDETEVKASVGSTVLERGGNLEAVVSVVYQPEAVFRVSAVQRCSGTMPGHEEAVLSVHFSPNGRLLASGSGDANVRIWDVDTAMPEFTCSGHTNWILAVAWAPNGAVLASGSRDALVKLWDPITGNQIGRDLKGHTQFITALAWEPYHLNSTCTRLASSSKDGTIRIWDTVTTKPLLSLSGHTKSVTSVKWTGAGLLISCSQDRTIKVWNPDRGIVMQTLQGHGHWVNTMGLSSDHVLRTGPFDHTGACPEDLGEAQAQAQSRYLEATKGKGERLCSGSDDFTLFLWDLTQEDTTNVAKKPIARMTGHQQLVNMVAFSPNGEFIASASFDKSVKLWNGHTGNFVMTFRAHVGAVYQVCWSSDSRLLCSASKDSTLKVWDTKTNKFKSELPGHADEVYACDWSPDGLRVASGSKDRLLKMWRR